MNIYAFAVGIFIAGFVVLLFRIKTVERTKWTYPILLATFPLYYWVFAMYGNDYMALLKEFIFGLPFFVIAYLACRFRSVAALSLLAVGYVAHAVYDIYHDELFFFNTGVPPWWPEFCGTVDVLIGSYVASLAFSFRNQAAA